MIHVLIFFALWSVGWLLIGLTFGNMIWPPARSHAAGTPGEEN